MHLPPPPDSRQLLPPLLACLPTAFVSPRPPPALLPLLSPLLRQRTTFLSTTNTTTRSDGWLPLLAWDAERAAKLPAVVERMHLEPHPVSGEVELDDVRPAKYRRVDEETLHARLEVEQFELLPVYVWCETDEHGGTGAGWKLAELRSLEDLGVEDGEEWMDSVSEANDAAISHQASSRAPQIQHGAADGQGQRPHGEEEDDDDDDDYWASYDRTPGRRTPAQKHSPAPPGLTAAQAANRERTRSELEYYNRYGSEVQPAMDSHDPDEEHPELGESGLNGDTLLRPHHQQQQHHQRPDSRPNGASLYPADPPQETSPRDAADDVVEAPRPLSPSSSLSSSGSSPIERLESKAAEMSESEILASDRAQLAIQQHISTDIKSLFRLARSAGMERRDFRRIVKTELECLGMLEGE